MRRLTFYTKRDCRLCDEALEILERLAPELGFLVDQVDIEADAELFRRFRYDIPVIALDGEVVLSAPIEEEDVRSALGGRRTARPATESE